ncbi:glycosyltransferase family 4 protein [Tepidiphilus baoligensis]|uniref:Glycosyltransferase n=1 Tax=Tepidiphilus baoligensis TaxID=2698687 RepID=A0ABX1QM17_9PROT|nr:glycosyltransferase family 4 protein [Tepidiphilus baoligensis]NMH17000.1 glycosyltransferase [Tepidiphilus baoligensis]
MSRRLTVVQMLPALQAGGVERGTLEIAQALVEAGHRSIVISGGGRLVEPLVRGGSEHFTWDVGRKSPWTLLRYVRRLRALLCAEHVDILHLRSRMPAWVGYLAWRGMRPEERPRLVTTVHGFYRVGRYSAVMTRGEAVIAVSNSIRDYLLQHYPDVPPERIHVIPRGIDPAHYPRGYQPSAEWFAHWYEQFPQTQGKRWLTLPARLTRLKGHETFLELIATLRERFPDIHGLIVGGEDARRTAYAAALRHQVQVLGLAQHVTFTGHRSDLREILAASAIVYSLSRQPESFGRTTLETLALGRPVIGYAHGGIGEQLSSLFPIGAVPPGNFAALVTTSERMLAEPFPAPADLPAEYTLSAMCQGTLAVYHRLAAQQI